MMASDTGLGSEIEVQNLIIKIKYLSDVSYRQHIDKPYALFL